jgi:hypothetical protein
MSLALPVVAAAALGLLLGGRLGALAEIRLRAWWLFFLAFGLQVLAFPFEFLPWRTGHTTASAVWIASYSLLLVAAALNLRIPGVPLVVAGIAANVAAVLANGGTMPVLPEAMRAAGGDHVTFNNSTASAEPQLAWLVDRWAAPEWIPAANVFSVGDVLIAAGAAWIVLAGMGVRLPRRGRRATMPGPVA